MWDIPFNPFILLLSFIQVLVIRITKIFTSLYVTDAVIYSYLQSNDITDVDETSFRRILFWEPTSTSTQLLIIKPFISKIKVKLYSTVCTQHYICESPFQVALLLIANK